MKGTRWFDTAAIVVTIAVLVGLGFVLRPQPSPTIRVAPSSAHVDRPQLAAKTGPSALFIGDSYTRGYVKEMSYVCLAATQMGWVCNLSAVGSTGYLAGGPANRFDIDEGLGQSTSFAERIPKLAQTYQPDMVFLDGGRNDLDLPRDDVYDAMIWTIAGVRRVIWGACRKPGGRHGAARVQRSHDTIEALTAGVGRTRRWHRRIFGVRPR